MNILIEFRWLGYECVVRIKRLCDFVGIDNIKEKRRIHKNELMRKRVVAYCKEFEDGKKKYNLYYPLSELDDYIFGLIKIYPKKENILIAYYEKVISMYNEGIYIDKDYEKKLLKKVI